VRQCAAVRQCERREWQCEAVRAVRGAECGSAYGNMCAVRTAVFLVMYGSEHGSVQAAVRQCGSRECAAVCGSALDSV
jgi:hypothetical protein